MIKTKSPRNKILRQKKDHTNSKNSKNNCKKKQNQSNKSKDAAIFFRIRRKDERHGSPAGRGSRNIHNQSETLIAESQNKAPYSYCRVV